MEVAELETLVTDFEKLVPKLRQARPDIKSEEISKEYNTSSHDIYDTAKRRDKMVNTDDGASVSKVTRVGISYQKKIVALAATFLCGNPIEIDCQTTSDIEKDLLAVIKKTWEDNKLDYDSIELAKLMMSEQQVAELWYTEKAEPEYWKGTKNEKASFRLRMKILSFSKGDELMPVFNSSGDMIAFGRGYRIIVGDKSVEHIDLYTDKLTFRAVKEDNGWRVAPETNIIGKIPVIYYYQPAVEWADVQSMISRTETLVSNHGDNNDYFGSPLILVHGEITGFAKKGESGKLLQMKDGGKAEYLTWNQAPESIKMEYNILRSLIHEMTDTPDITFENMKGLGTYSGIALRMLFMGAHMKAAEKEGIFGKAIQRRLNYIKAAMAKINVRLEPATPLPLKPKFEYFLPKNIQEMVDILTQATGSKPVMSRETAVRLNPLVTNPDEELKRIKEEEEQLGPDPDDQ